MLELIRKLIKSRARPETFVAAMLLSIRDNSYEDAKIAQAYLKSRSEVVDDDVLDELYSRKIIVNLTDDFSKAKIMEEYKVPTKEESFDMAEELWSKYPAVLPLSGGGSFLARKGDDKHEVLKMYLERINYNYEKHKFVLVQLEIYTKLVYNQKINGLRIEQWISNEMWDTIPSIEKGQQSNFKTDI